jgi:hypothetical protein
MPNVKIIAVICLMGAKQKMNPFLKVAKEKTTIA